jgi:hypothetical protein
MGSPERVVHDRKCAVLAGLYGVSKFGMCTMMVWVRTIRKEQLLRDKAITRGTPVDGGVVEVPYIAEGFSRLGK